MSEEVMERFVINSINEMFRWKLFDKDLNNEDKHISQVSVEEYFRKSTDKLLWPKATDVLYSFTMIYYLGISLYDTEGFEKLYQNEKKKQPNNKLCRHSKKFLYQCSKEKSFKQFNENENLVNFVNNYFSLGNIIPIWPGGNEARGKMGILDIPEIFFNIYPEWTNALLSQHQNARLEDVVNNSLFLVSRKIIVPGKENEMTSIKGYKNAFSNLADFKKYVNDCTDFNKMTGFYFDYLLHRTKVIKEREKYLKDILSKMEISE